MEAAAATPPPRGPYLTAAVLCEKVLREQDGVLSAIRMVDQVTQAATGPEVPAQMPPMTVNLTALLVIRSGEARGRHTISVRPEDPSGVRSQAADVSVQFLGEDRGPSLLLDVALEVTQEGLYWIDVILNDQTLLTRMPLRVIYQPQRTGPPPPPSDPQLPEASQ
jgi:hypothetical protein